MKPFTFRDTDEYSKFLEYKSLKKDPEVKGYYKAKKKGDAVKTKIINQFEELEAFIRSSAFLAKKNMKPITFKDSEEYKKLLEYKRLKASPEIKEFYRFGESKEYANYLNTHDSKRLERYNELREYTASTGVQGKKKLSARQKKI